jgi:hypothetical protein
MQSVTMLKLRSSATLPHTMACAIPAPLPHWPDVLLQDHGQLVAFVSNLWLDAHSCLLQTEWATLFRGILPTNKSYIFADLLEGLLHFLNMTQKHVS